jgi:thiosulfate/3-mercaptopyruvate sulfurtransferase
MNDTGAGSPHLVSTEWLASRLGQPGMVIVDGSWYLPTLNRDPRKEYLAEHIPGAVFFDLDATSDQQSPLPHMLPTPTSFASSMRKLGIGDGAQIIVYDGIGLFSAPRIWWMLRAFGARDVVILDGGLPKWKAENRPLEDGEVRRAATHFNARLDNTIVATMSDVQRALETGSAQILDARPAERFRGEAPEPRPGLRKGHIPGSKNVPFAKLVENGRLKPAAELVTVLDELGIEANRPVITSCGSGVSAATLTLALTIAGRQAGTLYDGSFAEWGLPDGPPVAPES